MPHLLGADNGGGRSILLALDFIDWKIDPKMLITIASPPKNLLCSLPRWCVCLSKTNRNLSFTSPKLFCSAIMAMTRYIVPIRMNYIACPEIPSFWRSKGTKRVKILMAGRGSEFSNRSEKFYGFETHMQTREFKKKSWAYVWLDFIDLLWNFTSHVACILNKFSWNRSQIG